MTAPVSASSPATTPWVAPLPDKLWEGLDVLAAAGPSLAEAIDAARAAGDAIYS